MSEVVSPEAPTAIADLPATPTTFHSFKRLPLELRLKIWHLQDLSIRRFLFEERYAKPWLPCSFEKPPTVLSICRESRYEFVAKTKEQWKEMREAKSHAVYYVAKTARFRHPVLIGSEDRIGGSLYVISNLIKDVEIRHLALFWNDIASDTPGFFINTLSRISDLKHIMIMTAGRCNARQRRLTATHLPTWMALPGENTSKWSEVDQDNFDAPEIGSVSDIMFQLIINAIEKCWQTRNAAQATLEFPAVRFVVEIGQFGMKYDWTVKRLPEQTEQSEGKGTEEG